MGRELYGTHPVFKEAMDQCAEVLDGILEHPLYDVLFAEPGSPEADRLDRTGYTQPACSPLNIRSTGCGAPGA
jgi:acyl transferase domain-containing protein